MKELFSAILILMCFSFSVLAMPTNDTVATPSASPDWDCVSVCDTEVIINTEFVDSTTMDAQTEPDLTVAPTNEGLTGLSTETLALNTSYEAGWRS